MSGGPGYWSRLTLQHGSPPDVVPYGPGDVTDADDEHLRVLRRTIVEPVVASLLTAEELESLSVHRGVGGEADEVWVRVIAVGEVFLGFLAIGDGDELSAQQLADNLEDWIAESGFGWGQQRTARYVLPPS